MGPEDLDEIVPKTDEEIREERVNNVKEYFDKKRKGKSFRASDSTTKRKGKYEKYLDHVVGERLKTLKEATEVLTRHDLDIVKSMMEWI